MIRGALDRLNRYRFDSTWRVRAEPEAVWDLLHDLEAWPRWWREIHESERVDEDTAEVRVRSVLPYDLHLRLTRERDDAQARVLEARIERDLEGWARFTLRRAPAGTLLRYEQAVVVRKPLMRALAPVVRPLFVWNHSRMMRSGERGLREALGLEAGGRPS